MAGKNTLILKSYGGEQLLPIFKKKILSRFIKCYMKKFFIRAVFLCDSKKNIYENLLTFLL